MPTSTTVSNLNINELTEAQFDEAVRNGIIGEYELSVLTDADVEADGPAYEIFDAPTDLKWSRTYLWKGGARTVVQPQAPSWAPSGYQPANFQLGAPLDEESKFYTPGFRVASFELSTADYAEPLWDKAIFDKEKVLAKFNELDPDWYKAASDTTKPEGTALYAAIVYNGSEWAISGEFLGLQDGTVVDIAEWGVTFADDYTPTTGDIIDLALCYVYGYGKLSAPLVNNATGSAAIAVGQRSSATGLFSIAVGVQSSATGSAAMAIGPTSSAQANNAIQIGNGTNTTPNTTQIRNYQVLDANGKIPSARLSLQKESMGAASASEYGYIYQYIGITDSNYTNGYFYKWSAPDSATATVSQNAGTSLTNLAVDVDVFKNKVKNPYEDGTFSFTYQSDGWYAWDDGRVSVADLSVYGITFDGTPVEGDGIAVVYSLNGGSPYWQQVDVQPSSGGSSYTAGNGINIDANNEISVTDPVLVNTATGTGRIGILGTVNANNSIAIGNYSEAKTTNEVAIGLAASVGGTASIAIGSATVANGAQNCVAIGQGAAAETAGNAIAIGPFAKAANSCMQITFGSTTTHRNSDADTLKVGNSNGNFEIMSANGTIPTARLTKVNTTATLAVADWSSNTQTITVSGVKADSVVFVSPAPASVSDYASAGILCTSQSADSLTFSCTQTPSAAIDVNIVCM